MRPIDADALFRKIKNSDWLPHERINAMKMVREQPTIEQPQWISCAERLPNSRDGDKRGNVIAVSKYGKKGVWNWHSVCQHAGIFEWWLPISALPMPPKEDE